MTLARLTALFPLWVVLAAALGGFAPEPFAAAAPAIVPLLGIVMFGMGLTLTAADFRRVATRPAPVVLGLALQLAVMPAAGWLAATICGLDPVQLAGMVLVGAVPVGTAASVVVYLGRGDVALAVVLTALSTLLAIVATPLLAELWSGHEVALPVGKLLLDVVQIVLLPVAAGTLVNALWGARLAALRPAFPLLSVVAVCFVVAIVVGLSQEALAAVALPVEIAVVLHNALGLVAGYAVPAALGMDIRTRRTLAIVVGMQNSGLAVALAVKYLGAGANLPGALFSVWHIVSGSLLAGRWSRDGR